MAPLTLDGEGDHTQSIPARINETSVIEFCNCIYRILGKECSHNPCVDDFGVANRETEGHDEDSSISEVAVFNQPIADAQTKEEDCFIRGLHPPFCVRCIQKSTAKTIDNLTGAEFIPEFIHGPIARALQWWNHCCVVSRLVVLWGYL